MLLQAPNPELAERMVRDFGMDPAVLDHNSVLDLSPLSGVLRSAWRTAREAVVGESARRCSGGFLQFVLNFLFIIPACHVGVTTACAFWRQEYLPGDFYRHAAVVLLLIWLLASWIVQWRLNVAARAIPRLVAKRFSEGAHTTQLMSDLAGEVARLARLASA